MYILRTLFCLLLVKMAFGTPVQDIEVRLESYKETYLELEQIWVKITIKNNDVNEIEIPYYIDQAYETLKFIMKDENGQELVYKGGYFDLIGEMPKRKLLAGEQYESNYALTYDFGDYAFSKGSRLKLNKGKYSLIAVLLLKEPVMSNRIFINIVEPVGNDKIVYDKIENIYLEYKKNRNYHWAFDSYYSLYKEFPESKYKTVLLNFMLVIINFKMGDVGQYKNIAEDFLNNHYKHPIAGDIAMRYYGALRDRDRAPEAKQFFMNLKQKAQNNSELIRVIDERLAKTE